MRLIDADALIEEIAKTQDLRTLSTKTIGEAIDRVPSAQKTGKWREYNYPGQEHVYCSSCKEEYYVDDLLLGRNEYPNYCPNCGASMRGGYTNENISDS